MADEQDTISALRETGRDALIYLPSRILPAIASIVAIKVFTVLLPKDEYGAFKLVLYAVGLAMTVLFGWIKHSTIRFYETYLKQDNRDRLATTVGVVVLVIAGLVAAGGWLIEPFLTGENRIYAELLPLAIAASLTGGLLVVDESFQRAARKPVQFGSMWITEAWGKLGLGVWFVLGWAPTAFNVLLGVVWTQLVVGVTHLWWFVRSAGMRLGEFRPQIAKRYLSFGVPMIGSGLTLWGLTFIDRFLLEFFLGESAVANYSVAYDLPYRGLQLALGVVMIAGYPVVLDLYESGEDEEARGLMGDITRVYVVFGGMVAGAIAAFPELWIRLLSDYGKYGGYADLIPIVAVSIFFFLSMQYTTKGFELEEKTNQLLAVHLSGLALNVGLNIWLIPRFGEFGAAWASVISFAVLAAAGFLGFRYWSYPFPWTPLVRTALIAGALFPVGYWLDGMYAGAWWLIFAVPAWMGIYLGLQHLTGDRTASYLPELIGDFLSSSGSGGGGGADVTDDEA